MPSLWKSLIIGNTHTDRLDLGKGGQTAAEELLGEVYNEVMLYCQNDEALKG